MIGPFKYGRWVMIIISLIACETQFDFDEDGQGANQLIINGVVDNSEGPYFITVQQTVKGINRFPSDVSNACVMLVDQYDNRETCDYTDNGIYLCNGDLIKGTPGMGYMLEVTIEEEIIISKMDIMPSQSFSDFDINWRQGKLKETSQLGIDVEANVVFIDLKSDFQKSKDIVYINWVGEEIYQFLQKRETIPYTPPPPCYIIANYGGDKIRILNNATYNGLYQEDKIMFRRIDDSFLRKHIISIFQYSISKEYYEYLERIKVLVENNGSLFDAPPGRAIGNMMNTTSNKPVNGFFRSVLVDTASVAIYPSQLEGILIQDGCVRNFTIERCFDCPNTGKYSGFGRPEYYDRITE